MDDEYIRQRIHQILLEKIAMGAGEDYEIADFRGLGRVERRKVVPMRRLRAAGDDDEMMYALEGGRRRTRRFSREGTRAGLKGGKRTKKDTKKIPSTCRKNVRCPKGFKKACVDKYGVKHKPMKTKKRQLSDWQKHVEAVRKKYGLTFEQALFVASKSWDPNPK